MNKISATKVGLIGCGNISTAYLRIAKTFDVYQIEAVTDLDMERARARAIEFGVPKVYSLQEMLQDPEIEAVLNLTVPKAHAEVTLAALQAGKHVYSEKPLAIYRQDGKQIIETAHAKGLRVGCAPDTFLGGGLQTCRKLIDDGVIGQPVAAVAFMMGHGPEGWHPDPEFFYQKGGGPMFDMGPYYLTALTSLLGPVRRVTGFTRISFPERTITSKPKYGTKIQVEIPTHVVGALDFATGAVGTIITSFDVWASELPRIEIYGSKGSLSVPDPNTFGGPVRVRLAGESEWSVVPLTHGYTSNSRGVGLADMIYGLRSGRPHRASGALAFHVLDIMESIHNASDQGCQIELNSAVNRPAALPVGLKEGELDA